MACKCTHVKTGPRGPGFRGRRGCCFPLARIGASRLLRARHLSRRPGLRLDALAHPLHRRLQAVPIDRLHALPDDGLDPVAIDGLDTLLDHGLDAVAVHRLDALTRLAGLSDQLLGDLTPDVAALRLGLLEL